jgi:hypothetical protein
VHHFFFSLEIIIASSVLIFLSLLLIRYFQRNTLQKMGRTKQAAPLQRAPSSDIMQEPPDIPEWSTQQTNGHATKSTVAENGTVTSQVEPMATESSPGLMQLAICVAGIYASL